MTRNKDSTRYFSSKQEEYVAKLINGRTVSNSGAAKFTCGDVISDDLVNVPVEDTFITQLFKQFDAEMPVASIVMLFNEAQPLNMFE